MSAKPSGLFPPNHNNYGSEKIETLFIRLALPLAFGMILNGLYNVVDAIFVSKYISTDAFSSVSLVFPLQMLIIAIAVTISNGVSILVSQKTGENNLSAVKRTETTGLVLIIASYVAVLAVVLPNLDFVFTLLNVPNKLTALTSDYLLPIVLGSVLTMLLSLFCDLLRAKGLPNILFLVILLSTSLNIAFNWLFIVVLELNIAGAAYATLCGQFIAALFALKAAAKSSPLLPSYKFFNFRIKTATKILSLGSPFFFQFLGVALVLGLVNSQIQGANESTWLAAYGVASRLNIFLIFPLLAIAHATQTIVGHNYGEGNQQRVFDALHFALKIGSAYLLVMQVILFVFPQIVIAPFTDNTEVLRATKRIIDMMFLTLPIAGLVTICVSFFQGVDAPIKANLVTIVKIYGFLLPSVYLLSKNIGFESMWYAFPISDVLVAVLCFIFMLDLKTTYESTNEFRG